MAALYAASRFGAFSFERYMPKTAVAIVTGIAIKIAVKNEMKIDNPTATKLNSTISKKIRAMLSPAVPSGAGGAVSFATSDFDLW